MDFSRRTLIGAGAAASALTFLPGRANAAPGSAMPDWQLGYRTAPADGFGPAQMKTVFGSAPAGLNGTLYRNGPGQFHYGDAFASHWFDGDGMIQKITISDGNAVHTGRFVDTHKRREEQKAGKFLAPGFGTEGDPDFPITHPDDVNAANTSVIVIDGKLYALWEGGSAYRLDKETLTASGPKSWRDDLSGMPFLAHPKTEPNGRVWNLGTSGNRVVIYKISPNGDLEDFQLLDVGIPSYIHDWAMTERQLIILVQPWVYTRNIPPFVEGLEWKPEEGMKYLIIDKDDLTKQRWVQGDARAFFHTGAAWEESDGTLRFDVAYYKEPVLGPGGGTNEMKGIYEPGGAFHSDLTQVIIPVSGDAKLIETGIDGDFPQQDPRRHGLARDLTALVTGTVQGRPGASALTVHNWSTGTSDTFDFGAHRMVEEHLFVPKPGGTKESDCWLVGTALNTKTKASEVWVFDAASISDGPIVIWSADYAWPLGFHGTWA